MLKSFECVCELIKSNKLLHIAGGEALLQKLPKGKWIGGSTECFMAQNGGVVSDTELFVTEFDNHDYKIKTYDETTIDHVAADGFDNGLSVLIIPHATPVLSEYAKNSRDYKDMFIKPVVGWVSGKNPENDNQIAIAVNGETGEILQDKAAVLHIKLPEGQTASLHIINIHHQDKSSPVIEFLPQDDGTYDVEKCLIDGKESFFCDYLTQNNIPNSRPLVGDYSGNGVNLSILAQPGDCVQFAAPVFSGIKYRFALKVDDYAAAFNAQMEKHKDAKVAFSCNCIHNFLYGKLEGKKLDKVFHNHMTFGEIAYQLLNQTMVYASIS